MTTKLQRKQVISEDISTKPKERRIVTWTPEEDDILREQISIHGTENWTIIASKFTDKTTRQCRRRWYTYLNSDFKKGGWSPEEDVLLCEAQKIFGNKWTEIAKVVSGRTDNAVKNRFTTLCKKRAKHEALAKENGSIFTNTNNKRVLIDNGFRSQGSVHIALPLKKLRRAHIPNPIENCDSRNMLHKECGITDKQERAPFAVLAHSVGNGNNSPFTSTKEGFIDGSKKTEGTFLGKDDPNVAALMQQSLENAWKVVQNFFSKTKESEDVDLQLYDLKDLVEDLKSSSQGIQPPRQCDVYESQSSSEYSNGSTIFSTTASEQGEQSQSVHVGDSMSDNNLVPCMATDQEFSSPLQVTPLFRSLASTVPSPQFSESERHFLLKTLGIESPPPKMITNPLRPPPCRKALLQGL